MPGRGRPTRAVDWSHGRRAARRPLRVGLLQPHRFRCAMATPASFHSLRVGLLPAALPSLRLFFVSFSSRGGGVGFGEGLGEGGVLAPCEEGSGGGVRPLCVGAPGPADAAVLPVRFRRPAALLMHCLCLQAIGEFQIHSIVRLPLSS